MFKIKLPSPERHDFTVMPWFVGALLLAGYLIAAALGAQALGDGRVVLWPGASTDCGPNGSPFVVNQAIEYRDAASARLRYGPCAFTEEGQCGRAGTSNRCINTESDQRAVWEWAAWQQLGCPPADGSQVTVPPGYRWPTSQEVQDAGMVRADRGDLAARMQRERLAACPLGPSPTPVPTPSPAVTPAPTPTPTPTPAPTALPTCEPARVPPALLDCARQYKAIVRGTKPSWGPVRDGCSVELLKWMLAIDGKWFKPATTTGQLGRCVTP